MPFGSNRHNNSNNSNRKNSMNNNSSSNKMHNLLNNLANSGDVKAKNETVWFVNIIPLFLICAFALAFRIKSEQYSFCNISNVCGKPKLDIIHTLVKKNRYSKDEIAALKVTLDIAKENKAKIDKTIVEGAAKVRVEVLRGKITDAEKEIKTARAVDKPALKRTLTNLQLALDRADDEYNNLMASSESANIEYNIAKKNYDFATTINSNMNSINNNNLNNKYTKGDPDDVKYSTKVVVQCPENTSSEPHKPKSKPMFIVGVLWACFILTCIMSIYVVLDDTSLAIKLLMLSIPVTFLGLAIDATVNQNVGRSVTAVISMVIMSAVLIAIVNIGGLIGSNGGSSTITASMLILAGTLIGILAKNKKEIEEGYVGYAINDSITTLLFILNIVYVVVLLAILIIAIVNIGLVKTLASEYATLLMFICMLSQIAVYANYLYKCLEKKYKCIPSIHLDKNGISKPEDEKSSTATRLGKFTAQCDANGISKLNTRNATIAISVLTVVIFLLSMPRTLYAITSLTGWGNRTATIVSIIISILMLVLSFIK